jgi:3-dehydroquinate synthase
VDANVAASWPALVHDVCAYADAHAESLELVGRPEVVAGGEHVKNDPALVTSLQRRLVELNIDRHAFVVGIGGGAFLDMIGFVAATTHRGIRHVRVPTTVLGQNDSGVGVKNGINAFGMKNLLGSFAPPFAVLNDADFLRTLHPRDKIAGVAEAVKVALIRDGMFFEWLEGNAEGLRDCAPAVMARMIRRCAELHMRQIALGGDPFETGSARPLDYGHWSAHKLEGLTAHELRHGEAVSIGLALDARYSVQVGMLPAGGEERVYRLLKRLGFYLWHPAMETRDDHGHLLILRGIEEFREHLGGELTITLLREIGRGEEVHVMDNNEILHAMAWLRRKETGQ